jgi:hypothetical protein
MDPRCSFRNLLWVMALLIFLAGACEAQNRASLDLKEDPKASALSIPSITRMVVKAMQDMGCTVREQDMDNGFAGGSMRVPNDPYGREISIRVAVVRDLSGKISLPIETVDCPDCTAEGGYSSQELEVKFIQYFLQVMNNSPEYLSGGSPLPPPQPLKEVQPARQPAAPTIRIGKVDVKPATVKTGSKFNFVTDYTVTDSSTARKEIPVQFRFSILEGSNILYSPEAMEIQSLNGGTMKRTEPVTASRKKGTYELKVSVNYRDVVAEKSVIFKIK